MPPTRRTLDPTAQAAWVGFLSTHARIVRRLDAALAASHGLTLSEFEVLLKLAQHGGRLRMSDLAAAAWVSRSGLTRIVDELEAQGLVARVPDEDDGRVLQAELTRPGRTRFAAARRAHLADVHALFLDPLTERQRAALGEAWAAIAAALPDQPDELEPTRGRTPARRAGRPGRATQPARR